MVWVGRVAAGVVVSTAAAARDSAPRSAAMTLINDDRATYGAAAERTRRLRTWDGEVESQPT